ncbi:unnamed protein product [Protopolystoma xenopodis]|uniref:Uncharacterized protein n=1 Tax=Protopolystoma xenopodis TaxID=117903 RepID=A0A3S5FD73_9PLAT|nr:unnamed protein product [Protopolystoma xenopodis]
MSDRQNSMILSCVYLSSAWSVSNTTLSHHACGNRRNVFFTANDLHASALTSHAVHPLAILLHFTSCPTTSPASFLSRFASRLAFSRLLCSSPFTSGLVSPASLHPFSFSSLFCRSAYSFLLSLLFFPSHTAIGFLFIFFFSFTPL